MYRSSITFSHLDLNIWNATSVADNKQLCTVFIEF
jgi:hypothetical protein